MPIKGSFERATIGAFLLAPTVKMVLGEENCFMYAAVRFP